MGNNSINSAIEGATELVGAWEIGTVKCVISSGYNVQTLGSECRV